MNKFSHIDKSRNGSKQDAGRHYAETIAKRGNSREEQKEHGEKKGRDDF
jgi:hypothetical protein